MIRVIEKECNDVRDINLFEDEIIKEIKDKEVILAFINVKNESIYLGKYQPSFHLRKNVKIPFAKRKTGGGAIIMDGSELAGIIFVKNNKSYKENFLHFDYKFYNWLKMNLKDIQRAKYQPLEYRSVECFNTIYAGEHLFKDKKIIGSVATKVDNVYIHHFVVYIEPSYKKLSKYMKEDREIEFNKKISVAETQLNVTKMQLKESLIKVLNE